MQKKKYFELNKFFFNGSINEKIFSLSIFYKSFHEMFLLYNYKANEKIIIKI